MERENMIGEIYNPIKILGFTAIFIIIVSFASYAQNGSSQTNQTSTPTASSNQNTSASQKSSFESSAAQFANDLAQQTGLSADKADKIRAVLVDYYNDITNTRQEFMRDRRDPRSQDANNSRMGNNTTDNNNTNDNRDVIGGQNGNNNNNAIGGNAGTGSTSDNSLNGTSTTGQGGTGTGITGTDASSGTNGANQAKSNQDLMNEYRKADMKADKKILDVFDNDSQKAKYVQVKRQWWQNVKNKAFSDEDQSSGGIQD
jgi:hypothetical protein